MVVQKTYKMRVILERLKRNQPVSRNLCLIFGFNATAFQVVTQIFEIRVRAYGRLSAGA